MTFSFFRSDIPVYITVSLRPIGPCQPSQAMAGPVFSHLRNPYLAFLGGIHNFLWTPLPGAWAPIWGFPDFRYLDPFRPQAPHQQFGTQSGNFGPPSLGYSVTVPLSHVCYGQHYRVLYHQTGLDPFPHPVTSSSVFIPMATNSRHGHQSQAHSRVSERDSGLSRPNQPIKTEWSLHLK